jgi:hypothetical protein
VLRLHEALEELAEYVPIWGSGWSCVFIAGFSAVKMIMAMDVSE